MRLVRIFVPLGSFSSSSLSPELEAATKAPHVCVFPVGHLILINGITCVTVPSSSAALSPVWSLMCNHAHIPLY